MNVLKFELNPTTSLIGYLRKLSQTIKARADWNSAERYQNLISPVSQIMNAPAKFEILRAVCPEMHGNILANERSSKGADCAERAQM